jgi:hypothetical protein
VESINSPQSPELHPGVRHYFDEHAEPGSRYITKYTNFFDIYDHYLDALRSRPVRMIEIGVQHGGSLQMWKSYLHPDSLVVGIDIYSACKQYEEDGIKILIGDQSDRKFLAEVVAEVGPVDFILDDGSHIPRHQISSFEYLFRHGLSEGGVYMVEDCFTSYWRRFGGGLRKRGTFIEYSKNVIDEINFWHLENPPAQRTWRTDMIEAVEFRSAVVAFRKGNVGRPERIDIGDKKLLDLEEPFRDGALGEIILRAKQVPIIQAAVRRTPFLWSLMKRLKKD